MIFRPLEDTVAALDVDVISRSRRKVLRPLVDFICSKLDHQQEIRLVFVCTHNSRRSHLAQVWAQTMAHYFGVGSVVAYSGGTQATAMSPSVAKTLIATGYRVTPISSGANRVYAIKFAENEHPVMGFSKIYDHDFNPRFGFAAVMTCSQADRDCPYIEGAEKRISLPYEDPKLFDGTKEEEDKYLERSQQIAAEMHYVFSEIGR
ncbi:protein-tyrosine-phosphatase [Flavobacteriaceae bacterium F89]|uniref:Protein-tyrosine-phosphatase n=1 Tax=Cerina litoralis TaxID=2874477 RepID=A0AAE3ETY6_9FLAO|nr:protein-tyrosine-phosphatase [Cerina litoralis]MCG2461037.1 protein-tyrosine-phosphatase [Cerina litoralis]